MKGIIGAIAGDIIGSTYEFHPIKTKEFSLFNKKVTFLKHSKVMQHEKNGLFIGLVIIIFDNKYSFRNLSFFQYTNKTLRILLTVSFFFLACISQTGYKTGFSNNPNEFLKTKKSLLNIICGIFPVNNIVASIQVPP